MHEDKYQAAGSVMGDCYECGNPTSLRCASDNLPVCERCSRLHSELNGQNLANRYRFVVILAPDETRDLSPEHKRLFERYVKDDVKIAFRPATFVFGYDGIQGQRHVTVTCPYMPDFRDASACLEQSIKRSLGIVKMKAALG